MVRIALALLALTTTSAATAASWRMVVEGEQGAKIWIDDDSRAQTKDYTWGWIRVDSTDGTYTTSLIASRCASRTYMYLKMVYYDRYRRANNLSSRLDGKWEAAVPDTIMDVAIADLCDGQ